MVKYIKKLVLSKYVKGLLDKLPLNKYKTILGIVIIAVGAAVEYYGESSVAGSVLKLILDVLKSVDGVVPIQDTGIVVFIVGIVHKLLKALERLTNKS